jgi:hypothetical protein
LEVAVASKTLPQPPDRNRIRLVNAQFVRHSLTYFTENFGRNLGTAHVTAIHRGADVAFKALGVTLWLDRRSLGRLAPHDDLMPIDEHGAECQEIAEAVGERRRSTGFVKVGDGGVRRAEIYPDPRMRRGGELASSFGMAASGCLVTSSVDLQLDQRI